MAGPLMSRGGGGRRYKAMSEINVTPLVDVLLVLVVILLVTAPLLASAGVQPWPQVQRRAPSAVLVSGMPAGALALPRGSMHVAQAPRASRRSCRCGNSSYAPSEPPPPPATFRLRAVLGLLSLARTRHVPHVWAFDEARHERLSASNEHNTRDRHATLARRAEAGGDERLDGRLRVGVLKDHRVVLGAQVGLDTLAVRAAAIVDVLTRRVA
jgi:hypothetical protein